MNIGEIEEVIIVEPEEIPAAEPLPEVEPVVAPEREKVPA